MQHSAGIWLFTPVFDRTTSLLYKKGHFDSVFYSTFLPQLVGEPDTWHTLSLDSQPAVLPEILDLLSDNYP